MNLVQLVQLKSDLLRLGVYRTKDHKIKGGG